MRLAVINEIRGTKAVVDYRQYGTEVKITLSWIVGCKRDKGGGGAEILIFQDYELLSSTKSKDQAWQKVLKILETNPADLTEEMSYLKRAIYG